MALSDNVIACGNCAYAQYYETCGFRSCYVFSCTQFGIKDVDPNESGCTFGKEGYPDIVFQEIEIGDWVALADIW